MSKKPTSYKKLITPYKFIPVSPNTITTKLATVNFVLTRSPIRFLFELKSNKGMAANGKKIAQIIFTY